MLRPDMVLQERYQIKRLIARGGMGAVYEAQDLRLGHCVALKETLVDDEKLRRAFEREAKILAHLHHPMLPGVSDHFVHDDGQYLVMRYIPGDDLGKNLKQQGGPLPLPQVLAWGDQLLDLLDYLHNQKPPIVHRDIKPPNLKVTARGDIMLLDFGLAKGGQFTQTRSLFAYTLHYAPLEQIQGSETDARSDLYSLGATLYHLLTGTQPPDALTRATSLLNSQPDPLQPAHLINAQVPPALSKLLMEAMSQKPDNRPSSSAVMRQMWRMFLPDRSTGRHNIPQTKPTSELVETRAWDQPKRSDVVSPISSEVETRALDEPTTSDSVPPSVPHPPVTPEEKKRSNPLLLILLTIVAMLLLLLIASYRLPLGQNSNGTALSQQLSTPTKSLVPDETPSATEITQASDSKESKTPTKEANSSPTKKSKTPTKEATSPPTKKSKTPTKEATSSPTKKSKTPTKEATSPPTSKTPTKEATSPLTEEAETPTKEAFSAPTEEVQTKEATSPLTEEAETPTKEATSPLTEEAETPTKEATSSPTKEAETPTKIGRAHV